MWIIQKKVQRTGLGSRRRHCVERSWISCQTTHPESARGRLDDPWGPQQVSPFGQLFCVSVKCFVTSVSWYVSSHHSVSNQNQTTLSVFCTLGEPLHTSRLSPGWSFWQKGTADLLTFSILHPTCKRPNNQQRDRDFFLCRQIALFRRSTGERRREGISPFRMRPHVKQLRCGTVFFGGFCRGSQRADVCAVSFAVLFDGVHHSAFCQEVARRH